MPSRPSPKKSRQPKLVPKPVPGKRPRPLKKISTEGLLGPTEDEYLEEEEIDSDVEIDSEPSDDSEVEEAETGLADEFTTEQPEIELTTEPESELDADTPNTGVSSYPALTFFKEQDGGVGYVVSEHRSELSWQRLDGLARFLIEQAGSRSWQAIMSLYSRGKIPQATYLAFLGPISPAPKGEISDMLRTTTLSLEGTFVSAITFFRENVDRTKAGRERAHGLLISGVPRKSTLSTLVQEFGVPRTTALGWIKYAEQAHSS